MHRAGHAATLFGLAAHLGHQLLQLLGAFRAVGGARQGDRFMLGALRIFSGGAKPFLAVFRRFDKIVQNGSDVGHVGAP
jgi:hypothetical protein